ncbi:MAG TPA: DNA repair and recombination protein RadB [Candidatus Nanoarchaeia archaeon]|nr:DNA repair and recombination protein RadB [Candidatus Nanoarchaeia archaeon]
MTKISTGSFDLNSWLNGGYEKDIITMIAGPPGSGKTNFSILASCSQSKDNKKVIFIDTEGGFSIERVKQIVGVDNHEKILENIFLLKPTNFEEQKKCFEKLLIAVKKEQIGLIVVDGMAMLYRLELGDAIHSKDDSNIREINREIATQMRVLAEISRKQEIPILITNQVYSGFVSEEDWKKGLKGEANIVGGDLFKYWSKCIIELKNDGGKKKAILLKHRNLKPKELSFEIRDEGIFRKGWI